MPVEISVLALKSLTSDFSLPGSQRFSFTSKREKGRGEREKRGERREERGEKRQKEAARENLWSVWQLFDLTQRTRVKI